jgi:putative hydrolase of the HAD superfamily
MMPVCVVFDLDDTLILERDYVLSGFTAVGSWAQKQFRIHDFASRACRALAAGRRGDIFDSVLRDCGCEPCAEDIQEMVTVYRRHRPQISLLPDAAAFIDSYRGLVRMALISDGPFESQFRKVSALRLRSVFELIVLTDMWGRRFWKPHPRAFRLIQDRIGASKLRYVYVADNPHKDFDAPAALNWHTVRVRRHRGFHASYEPASAVKPDIEISDLTALPDILRSMSQSFRCRVFQVKAI